MSSKTSGQGVYIFSQDYFSLLSMILIPEVVLSLAVASAKDRLSFVFQYVDILWMWQIFFFNISIRKNCVNDSPSP